MTTIKTTTLLPWTVLLDLPEPLMTEPSKTQNLVDKKAVSESIWSAIDSGDPVALREALQEGHTQLRRGGSTPLHVAVERARQDLTDILLEAGADIHAKTAGKETLWSILAVRDDPAEAQTWMSLGLRMSDISIMEFVDKKAYQLMDLVVDRAPELIDGRYIASSAGMLEKWVTFGVCASSKMRRRINQALGLDTQNPSALARHNPEGYAGQIGVRAANAVWDEAFKRDDVGLAKELIADGWAPADSEELQGERQAPFALLAAYHKAWRISAWADQHPVFRTERERYLKDNPATWTHFIKDVTQLDRMVQLFSVDMTKTDAESGRSAAHDMEHIYVTKAMIDWWLKNSPDMLETEDHSGQTPLDGLEPSMKAYAQKVLLKKHTKVTSKNAAKSVGRRM